MRRVATAVGLAVLVAVVAGLVAGSAAAGGTKKLVEGTVYDTTCIGTGTCLPECPPPPHCGPITQAKTGKVICAQRAAPSIVCPLYKTVVCVQAPCPGPTPYPLYSGEGGVVKVRRQGSTTVLATVPIVEGHFKIALGFGRYMIRPFLPEPECWSGAKSAVWVSREWQGPLPSYLHVGNSCVAHPLAGE
jgi:hypothetical protein